MTILDWSGKGTLLWLLVLYHLNNVGVDGHHNDTCLTADGRQAICVANRYCRERFQHHLIPCGDSKICCPIPTTSSPSISSSPLPRVTRPSNVEISKNNPPDSRKPLNSQDKPIRELSSARPDRNARPVDSSDVSDARDGASQNPGRQRDRDRPKYDIEDNPTTREKDNRPIRPIDRPKHKSDGSPSIERDERPRRPAESSRDNSRDNPISTERDERIRRPQDRPRYNSDDNPRSIERDDRQRSPIDDLPFREPERRGRPKVRDNEDLLPSQSDDDRSKNPIHKPKDIPSRRPIEKGRPTYDRDDSLDNGRSRRPVSTHDEPFTDGPTRNSGSNSERRRQNRPSYEEADNRENRRRLPEVYDDVDEVPTRTRNQQTKPIDRPRFDDRIDKAPKTPGKVRFEDDPKERSSKPFERDRPVAPVDFDDDYDRSDYSPMPRSEAASSGSRRFDSDPDERRPPPPAYDRRRQSNDAPRHYPSEDEIEVARSPPRRDVKPTRDQSRNHSIIDISKSTDRFPESHGVSLSSQPKVPECGVKPYELFIAGGEESEPHEWPWMTAIFRRHTTSKPKTFICGGSLISTKYILTAAHCFVHNYKILPASTFVVRVGSHQLNSGEEYTVSDVLVHHNHSGADFFNDIALVRLASDVFVNDKVAPVCLPSTDMARENFVGRIASVAGWGDTAFRTGASRTLQHVSVPVVSGEECFAAYSRVKGAAFLARGSDHVICAGLREGGKDACLGDSGGPLMLKAAEDRWIVVGIVSLGYKCAEPGYPGVYTRVTHYLSWIQNNMKRN